MIFINPLEDHQVQYNVARALRNNEFERNDILERTMDQTLELTNRTEITFLSHNDTIAVCYFSTFFFRQKFGRVPIRKL